MNQIVKFNVTAAALKELQAKYAEVPDVSTKEGYEMVRQGISELVSERTGLAANKKKKKAEALAFNKSVDTEYNRILGILLSIETPMKEAKKAEDAIREEKKRLAAEKEQERVAAIEKDINTIRNVVLDCHGKTSLELSGIIASLDATPIEMDRFAEHTPIAEAAKLEAVKKLEELREQALETEKADEDRKVEDARLAELSQKLEDERTENDRVATIKDKVQAIKDRGAYDQEATADQILGRINVLKNTQPSKDVFEEFTEEAHMAVGLALGALKDFHTVRVEKERLSAAEEQKKGIDEEAKDRVIKGLMSDPAVAAEFTPENQVDTEKTNEDIEFAERMEFVDALVKLFPAVPTPTANQIYRAIKAGELPHVQLIGGENVPDE